MDIQRLRNLTTGKLHTDASHLYEDIEFLTGEKRIMTHHLGMACKAMKPWLKEKLKAPEFWNGEYDQTHEGEVEIMPMNETERMQFFHLFNQQLNPLFK